jgi:predicted nucleic-acid-binding Zn-ribbon protein
MDYENYMNSPEFKAIQEKREKEKCPKCGGTNHFLQKHKETCEDYEHIMDDHYDSPCMRGNCKHCNSKK